MFKKTLSKIWFIKQCCLLHNIIPKYAKIEIKGRSETRKKVKNISVQLWVKQEIKYLNQQMNTYNKKLLKMHIELHQKYNYI